MRATGVENSQTDTSNNHFSAVLQIQYLQSFCKTIFCFCHSAVIEFTQLRLLVPDPVAFINFLETEFVLYIENKVLRTKIAYIYEI